MKDGRRLDWLAKEESLWREHLTRNLTDLREPAICKAGGGETLRWGLLPVLLAQKGASVAGTSDGERELMQVNQDG